MLAVKLCVVFAAWSCALGAMLGLQWLCVHRAEETIAVVLFLTTTGITVGATVIAFWLIAIIERAEKKGKE